MTASPPNPGTSLEELIALNDERRAERLHRCPDAGAALSALCGETERLAVTALGRAVAAGEMLVALAERFGSPLHRAQAERVRGQTLAYAGRFDDALPHYLRAAEIAESSGLTIEAARARMSSIHALASLGRYDQAIAAGQWAREAFLRAGEPGLAARADSNLGATYRMRGDAAAALRHYDRARPALLSEPVALAQLDTNRGQSLYSLDDFDGAEAAYRAALPALEQAGMTYGLAIVESNLAELCTRRGQLAQALAHFERARRCLEQEDAPSELARVLTDRAEALEVLGLPADARAEYERALPELRRHGVAHETVKALAGLGRTLARMGLWLDARPVLDEAAAGYESLGNAAARARVDLVRAELALARGQRVDARGFAAAARNALRDRPVDAAVAAYHLARIAFSEQNHKEAESLLTDSIAAAERLGVAPLRADLLHARAAVQRAQGRSDAARADLRSAVELVERVRGALQAERFRAAFHGNRLAVYDDLISAALDSGEAGWPEAFSTIERAKGRALLDLMRTTLDQPADPAAGDESSEDAADLARMRTELNMLYSRLADARSGSDAERMEGYAREIGLREQTLEQLETRAASARGAASLYAPPVELSAVQTLVAEDAALVEYFLLGNELVALTVRREEVQAFRRLARADELVEQISRVHFQLRRMLRPGAARRSGDARLLEDVRRELGGLFQRALAPLGGAIVGAARLIVIPHGPLHAIPFHALWDGSRYLIESAEISYAPSATLLAHLTERPPAMDAAPTALVVGVPDAHAPQIENEARTVAAAFPMSRVLLGPAATAAEVAAACRRAAHIHLACHGHFSAERPLASGLKLADRWLSVRDLYALRLSGAFVTLSGCETGRTVVGTGDELVGLVRGFFAAGARTLLVSLWTVHDESTANLMVSFYRRAGYDSDGGGIASAWRRAQLEAMQAHPHPAFWAPFILTGAA